ncbi:helix-turn-helix domain-containing protein [Streptomyces griseorubiginosus]|uniref:helix-turn-helix domain-containing protein n=1 Tax=Streptomyces griseorubiginosus TaxID=67304 RepID=UPI002E7FCD3D|nr:helix-turn-helix domain-containing protein [Streptomyces griseorubiginosus]WUB49780.1 helix-turn-helix domain-containing protein [Streptomyces griseorubiginosus]WUB58309.1 helix-turn-helix domain-containing protein [Streptomyces griseorubiginosus]
MNQYSEAERLAAQLRALKERSGLSYDALAQRAGISRSSLHRYCAASSVPQDYGVLHRIATACGAASGELRELHRLWALADAERERRVPQEEAGEEAAPAAPVSADADQEPATVSRTLPTQGPASAPGNREPTPKRGQLPANRRAIALTAVAAVTVLGTVGWAMSLTSGPDEKAEKSDSRTLFSSVCSPVVSMGQHDECVREVQTLLDRHGADIDVDGDFGPQTLRRVTAFQVITGLPPNGVVTTATKTALYESKARMDTWSPEEARRRIREVFAEAPGDAVAIADCQSFLDPLHILPNTNGSRNWGLFQISDTRLRELGGTPRKALDPDWNIQAAKRLWSRDRDFHDWPHCERALRTKASPAPSSAPPTASEKN